MEDKEMHQICTEKYDRIVEHFDNVDDTLEKHDVRLGALEVARAEDRADIKNLCKSIESLTSVTRWFIGVVVAELVAIAGTLLLKPHTAAMLPMLFGSR